MEIYLWNMYNYFSKNYIIQFIHLFTIRQQNQARVHSKNLESYNFFKLYFYRPKAGAPLEVVR